MTGFKANLFGHRRNGSRPVSNGEALVNFPSHKENRFLSIGEESLFNIYHIYNNSNLIALESRVLPLGASEKKTSAG